MRSERRAYDVDGYCFAVDTEHDAIHTYLDRVFGQFPHPPVESQPPFIYRVHEVRGAFEVTTAGPNEPREGAREKHGEEAAGFFPTPARAAEYIQGHACAVRLGLVDLSFALHAAGLVDASGQWATLLAGPAGAGKSTLTVELIKRGMGFLSDEAVFLSFEDGAVRGFPRAIGVLNPGPSRANDRTKEYISPVELGGQVIRRAIPVRTVMLMTGFGGLTRLQPLSPAEGLPHLVRQVYAGGPAEPIMEALIRLVASADVLELTIGDPAAAAGVISGMSGQSRAA